jgi:hypothetical protein
VASATKEPVVKDLKAQKEKLKAELLGKKDKKAESDDELDIKDADFQVEEKASVEKKDADLIDMRTVLGFLNQNEWILNLNIGNIM